MASFKHFFDIGGYPSGQFTDTDGYTSIVVADKIPADVVGTIERHGRLLIRNPRGEIRQHHYWMNQPEKGWTHGGVDLYQDFEQHVDAKGHFKHSAWLKLPLHQRLNMEAKQQATAYKKLKEQWKESKTVEPLTLYGK